MERLKRNTVSGDTDSKVNRAQRWGLTGIELVVWSAVVLFIPAAVLLGALWQASDPTSTQVRVERPTPTGLTTQHSSEATTRLDLNRASAAKLRLLPGIGPVLSKRIVARREKQGPYRSIWELEDVKGISKATIRRLEPLITVE